MYRNCWMNCNQCRPWSDTAFCSIWSGSTLFAQTCLPQYLQMKVKVDLTVPERCEVLAAHTKSNYSIQYVCIYFFLKVGSWKFSPFKTFWIHCQSKILASGNTHLSPVSVAFSRQCRYISNSRCYFRNNKILHIYTPDIRSMWGYIVFAFPFVHPFVRTYVRSFVFPSQGQSFCVKVYKTSYFEDPLMDFVHIWHDGRYRSKVFISTIPTPGWPWEQGHGLWIFVKKSQGQSFCVKSL